MNYGAGYACKYCVYNSTYCDDWARRKYCSDFKLNWDILSEADKESVRNAFTEKEDSSWDL